MMIKCKCRSKVIFPFIIFNTNNQIFYSLSAGAKTLLDYDQIVSTLQKLRKKSFPSCTTPDQLSKLLQEHPEVRAKFGELGGEVFFNKIVGEENEKAMIFTIKQLVVKLERNFEMYADATFSVLPFKFKQLYIVHAEIEDKVKTSVFAFICLYLHIFHI